MPEGEAIEAGIVTRSIESAQRKVEARNFDIRKQLLEYDDVANDQRKVIYQQRNDILEAPTCRRRSLRCARADDRPGARVRAGRERSRSSGTCRAWRRCWPTNGSSSCRWPRSSRPQHHRRRPASRRCVAGGRRRPSRPRSSRSAARSSRRSSASCCCRRIDKHWREHLSALDYLRQGIHLRGYAQKNPKQEYKREAFELFAELLDVGQERSDARADDGARPVAGGGREAAEAIEEPAERHLPTSDLRPRSRAGRDGSALDESSGGAQRHARRARCRKVGRNEPCPCGSGKKYKQCHGRLA